MSIHQLTVDQKSFPRRGDESVRGLGPRFLETSVGGCDSIDCLRDCVRSVSKTSDGVTARFLPLFDELVAFGAADDMPCGERVLDLLLRMGD